MPRPRMNDDVDAEDAVNDGAPTIVNTPGVVDAGADVAGVDVAANDNADTGESKKPRGGKRLKVADGTLGLLSEPVKADVPKRGGGRGRTVSPQTIKTIELLKANPGESFLIGRYAAAAVADGEWKKNGISFSSSAVVITNTEGEEVTVFDRYAVYTPGTEVADSGAADQG